MKHGWKRTVWILALAGVAAVNPVRAQAEPEAEASVEAEVRRTAALMMYTKWMEAFRRCGMEEPERLASRFLQGPGERTWERERVESMPGSFLMISASWARVSWTALTDSGVKSSP